MIEKTGRKPRCIGVQIKEYGNVFKRDPDNTTDDLHHLCISRTS